jgi:hypothetical protein
MSKTIVDSDKCYKDGHKDMMPGRERVMGLLWEEGLFLRRWVSGGYRDIGLSRQREVR